MIILIVLIGFIVLIMIFRKQNNIKSDKTIYSKQDLNNDSDRIVGYKERQSKLKKKYSTFVNLNDNKPPIIKRMREMYKNKSLKSLVDLYFELLNNIINEKANKNYSKMLMYSQMSFALIEPLIIAEKEEYGTFNITSIPSFELSLPHFAVTGANGQIKNIKEIVYSFPELLPWKEKVERAKKMNKLTYELYKYIKDNPGILQKKLKKEIGYDDGVLISDTLYYMQLHNKIRKEKFSNINKLFVIKKEKLNK